MILSDEPILYPYVTQPDILVVMSQEAYTRFTPDLKAGRHTDHRAGTGADLRYQAGERVYGVPATRLAEELGKRMVLNIVMVGFFAAVTHVLSADSLRKAVADSVPPAMRDLNLRAFDKGFEFGLTKVRELAAEEHETVPSLEDE